MRPSNMNKILAAAVLLCLSTQPLAPLAVSGGPVPTTVISEM